jgi:hypothetical protein
VRDLILAQCVPIEGRETGQTGDWNWSCARRGGLGEKQKLGKQKAEMGSRHQAGNHLSAVSPVDAEIRIGGDQAMLSASLRFCGERNPGGQAGTLAFQLSCKMWPIKSLTSELSRVSALGRGSIGPATPD